MPTYSYQCENCHHQFDIFQHFTDNSLTECPECHQQALRKVYTPVGIVFKGSGFYATDSRSPSGQTSHHHENKENGSSAKTNKETSSAETKTDASPAQETPKTPGTAKETKKSSANSAD